MSDIYTVWINAEWRTSHPYEFDSEEKAEEFWDKALHGDLDGVVDEGDFRPDHTSELIGYGPGWIEEERR